MADVEVGLGAVVGDEDLAVLERVHRPGVDVEVGVELLHGDPQTARPQQPAEAGGREPLAERGGDASGDEHVLGRHRLLHGPPSYPRGTAPSEPDAPNEPPGLVESTRTSARTVATWPAAVSVPSTVATGRVGGVARSAGEVADVAASVPATTTPFATAARPDDQPGRARSGSTSACRCTTSTSGATLRLAVRRGASRSAPCEAGPQRAAPRGLERGRPLRGAHAHAR